MKTFRGTACWLFCFLLTSAAVPIVAQAASASEGPDAVPPIPVLITEKVNESDLVRLPGNTRPEATAKNDQGRVADSLLLEHMMLLLRRSPGQERALTELIERLHDPNSPDFHRWLTVQDLGETYGLAHQDIHAITSWLQSHGFSVNTV